MASRVFAFLQRTLLLLFSLSGSRDLCIGVHSMSVCVCGRAQVIRALFPVLVKYYCQFVFPSGHNGCLMMMMMIGASTLPCGSPFLCRRQRLFFPFSTTKKRLLSSMVRIRSVRCTSPVISSTLLLYGCICTCT